MSGHPSCDTNPGASPESAAVVSRSTILILAGTLMGMALDQGLQAPTQMYFALSGAVGLLSYLSLEGLARRRQRQAQKQAQVQAEVTLERRIHRHVPRANGSRVRQPHTERAPREPSFLTVTWGD